MTTTKTRIVEMGTMLGGFDQILGSLSGILNTLQKSFLQHKKSLLEDAAGRQDKLKRKIREFRNKIGGVSGPQEQLLAQLEAINTDLEELRKTVTGKVDGNILFSEKAAVELTELISGVTELFNDMRDLVVTENRILVSYVEQRAADLANKAILFNNEHEERLIKGICLNSSSIIYLAMTDTISSILSLIKNFSRVYGK